MSRICVIGLKGLPAYGGAATVGSNILRELYGQYAFTVYSISSHTHLKSGYINGNKQIVLKALKKRKINILWYYLRAAIHVLLFSQYDLIHVHHRDALFVTFLLRMRFKVVVTTHGMILTEKWRKYKWFFDLQDRIFFRFANAVTCVSKKDALIVSKYYHGDIIQIPNGISGKEHFSVISNTQNYIAFAAGRIVPSKGCHTFLKALKIINYHGKVLIVGDISQLPTYKKEIVKLARGLNAEFTGIVKNKKKLYELIGRARIFIFASTLESMSMMLLETASLKTPIICSDIPENRDIFTSEEVLYYEAGNPEHLSKKIQYALSNPDEMTARAKKAYGKLEENYNWRKIANRYAQVYEKLIAR